MVKHISKFTQFLQHLSNKTITKQETICQLLFQSHLMITLR